MKVIISPDSFKESIDGALAARAIAKGWSSVRPDDELVLLPVADGGEGTAAVFKEAVGGTWMKTEVVGPLGEEIDGFWLLLPDGKTAVMDVASASGLDKVRPLLRNPLYTTSFGTGQLMEDALDHGCKKLIIGLGGSATVDGGAGIFQALGGSLTDSQGDELAFGGGALAQLATIDTSELDPRLQEVEIVAACDVNNPLLGPSGAAAVFGPQKGAGPDAVRELDRGLEHLAQEILTQLGHDVAELPGAGAAGGLGAGLLAFCGARLQPGAELVLEASDFKHQLQGASLILTGEGRLDSQSTAGKIISALARYATEEDVPVIALVGSLDHGLGQEGLRKIGVQAIFPIGHQPQPLEKALKNSLQDLTRTAAMIARVIDLWYPLS